MFCYWCYWGWPKPIRDIYDDCVEKLGGDYLALEYGPAHVVWGDENWEAAQRCLDHLDEYAAFQEQLGNGCSKRRLEVARESLIRLLEVPSEMRTTPAAFLEDKSNNPADHPPPEHWECEKR
jgi:hypothetical protein